MSHEFREFQKRRFKKYLMNHVATNSMVCEVLGLKQKTTTWFKREFEKKGLLVEVRRDKCKVTDRYAYYITCIPEIVEKMNNLKHGQ